MKKLRSLSVWMLFAAVWYMIPYPIEHYDWIGISRAFFYVGSTIYLFCWVFVNENN